MSWNDTLNQYALMAAPYIVPPLALALATIIFKFVLANKKTRQYAKLLMNVMQGKLESSLGAEKSKQVLELWNTIVKEAESAPDSKSKAYMESYFVRRLKNAVDLSAEDEEHIKTILQWMHGQNQDISASSVDDNYQLPKLPCVCEL